MSPAATAQLAFAAEFALFLVSVAGLACALRPGLLTDRQWARSALASGFLGLATASFLRGTLIVEQADVGFLIGLRTVAGAAIAAGLIRWKGKRSTIAIAWGLVFLAGAPALGAVYYVDGNCPSSGTGATTVCGSNGPKKTHWLRHSQWHPTPKQRCFLF